MEELILISTISFSVELCLQKLDLILSFLPVGVNADDRPVEIFGITGTWHPNIFKFFY